MTTIKTIQSKYEMLSGHLDERYRRIWAAAEAKSYGYGGVSLVSRATGLARSTICRGLAEVVQDKSLPLDRVRKPGGGRKPVSHHDPSFSAKLENL